MYARGNLCLTGAHVVRVPNSFFGIRDFSYLRLGIRDNKAKSEILD